MLIQNIYSLLKNLAQCPSPARLMPQSWIFKKKVISPFYETSCLRMVKNIVRLVVFVCMGQLAHFICYKVSSLLEAMLCGISNMTVICNGVLKLLCVCVFLNISSKWRLRNDSNSDLYLPSSLPQWAFSANFLAGSIVSLWDCREWLLSPCPI